MANKIRVFIVDDSAVVRQAITHVLSRDDNITVIGTALDPIFALEKMKADWPDVIVLDIEMPRMDDLTFLRSIMADRPTPVVICSSLAEKGAQVALDALAAGAVSLITKPKMGVKAFLEDASNDIVQAVKAAAQFHPRARRTASSPPTSPASTPTVHTPRHSADVILPAGTHAHLGRTTDRLIAMGTSTGGTQALEAVLTALSGDTPGVVIVQHMPEKFTAMFAEMILEHPEFLDGMDERLRPLWLWHAVEESEHKSVAFDVYQQQVGNYWIRTSEMAFTSVFFTFFTGLHTVQLLRATGEQGNFKAIGQGLNVLLGRKGFFRGMLPHYLAYYRPDFHPNDRDSTHLRNKGLALLKSYLGDKIALAA